MFLKGNKNPNWKGNSVSIRRLHRWISENYGRPKKCADCGLTDTNKRYEWANISGKYKRNIKDFKRLCSKCHRTFDNHLLARGEKHGISKVNKIDVIEIRKLYVPYKFSFRKLSDKFKLSQTAIRNIISKETWKHV